MSQHNVELFHQAIDAYNRGDLEAYLQTAHPAVEWHPFTAEAEGGDPYRGHEGVRQWWSNVDAYFDTRESTVDEVRDLGDAVLAFGRVRMRFKSGVAFDQEIAWLARFRDGLFVWGQTYRSRAEALEAAGLRE